MARKCGRCRQEGHTVKTCTEASDVQHRAETRAMDAAIVASHKPTTRTCACGEVTTMGPFPGRHEADACRVPLEETRGHSQEEPASTYTDPFESPTHTHTYAWYDDDNGHSGSFCTCGQEEPLLDPFSSPAKAEKDDGPGPWFSAGFDSECATCDGAIFQGDEIRADGSCGYECLANCGEEETSHVDELPVADHRKWCSRCRLLGHYSADCTTAVLQGGVVSVPYPGSPSSITDVAENEPVGQDCKSCGHWTFNDSGRCTTCTEESDPFESPTVPAEEINVSGQPSARYEWRGKVNWGYLVKLPETGDFRRYGNGKPKGLTRATTFNKAATDQNALADWAKRNVLIGASKRPDVVAKAHGLTHEDNRNDLMKLVAELETAAGAKVSADIGTLIHELTERWDGDPSFGFSDVPAAYRDMIRLYAKTLADAGLVAVPGLIERTTYIPEFGGVVGTLDRVYYHERSGQYVIGDVKTGKTLKYGMDEIETQEWIYAHGVNNAGVYDWNTDTWQEPRHVDIDNDKMITVSEDWGVVVHMPVQGDDAGKVMLVRADLQRGKQHAQVCHDVREERANKPKPEPWTGEELKAPEMPETLNRGLTHRTWAEEFANIKDREQAAFLWQEAYDAGVSPEEMEKLKEIADARLAELTDKAFTPWEEDFRSVGTVADAGELWEDARKAGVEPMELSRLVGLAQQRLRELGVSG